MLVADQPRVQPLDDGSVAQARRVVGEVMRHHGKNVEAFFQLEAQRRIVLRALDHIDYILLRAQTRRTTTITAQTRTGAYAQQLVRLSQLATGPVQLVADAVMLKCAVDDHFSAV